MEETAYRKSLKEVYVILNSSNYEVINKLPDDLKEYIISKMDDKYDYKIDTNKSLMQQNMMDKTKIILAKIYQKYLYDNAEITRVEDEKRLKYNPEELFKDKKI